MSLKKEREDLESKLVFGNSSNDLIYANEKPKICCEYLIFY